MEPIPPLEETPPFFIVMPPEPAVKQPNPRLLPLILWYLWIGITSIIVAYDEHQRAFREYEELTKGMFIANLIVTPAWVALAIRPLRFHFVPTLLCILFCFFLRLSSRDVGVFALIFGIVIGTWSLLRWCRVVTIDLLHSESDGCSRTPRLADRVQFSLRSLILLSTVVALGITLYLFFNQSPQWGFYKIMFMIVVPSELLLFWSLLGRAKWYLRLPWLLVAVHHWSLLEIVQHGFQSWEQYDWDHFIRWLSIPLSQCVALGLLRWAGYRLGLPKPRERALPVAIEAEPQSPWD